MIIPAKKSIRLNRGFTYIDYCIKLNEIKTPYCELCHALKISFDKARASYDKTYNLPLEVIGTMKKSEHKPKYPYWNKAVGA